MCGGAAACGAELRGGAGVGGSLLLWTRGAISSRLAPGLLLCSSGWPVRASSRLTPGCCTRTATLQFNAARRSPWHPHAKRRGPCDVSEVHRTLMESFVRLAKIAENPPDQAFAATEIRGCARVCCAIRRRVYQRLSIQTSCCSRARCASSGALLLAAHSSETRSGAARAAR